jgi:glycosyltransferase involved in cell wall biosynthesis
MIIEEEPLISCVCVTKNRFELIKKSIECYINQTYINKNLFIVSQGEKESNDKILNFISSLNRKDIHFFVAPDFLSLGAMRNVSVELANGEIICQWDDDDLYHPNRISSQYKILNNNLNNSASIYCSFLKMFNNEKKIYWCEWYGENKLTHKFLCGSVMFKKSIFFEYDPFYPEFGDQSSCEEDLNVLGKLSLKGELAPVFSGNEYIYVFHESNTYNLEHHKLTLDISSGKKVFSNSEILTNKDLLESTFKLVNLEKPVNVCSLDGLVFKYE